MSKRIAPACELFDTLIDANGDELPAVFDRWSGSWVGYRVDGIFALRAGGPRKFGNGLTYWFLPDGSDVDGDPIRVVCKNITTSANLLLRRRRRITL